MSLLRLLTTGKSLVGLDQPEPCYRVTRERLLPRFGPVKNPFGTTERSESPQPEAGTRTERASGPSQPTVNVPQFPARNPSSVPGGAGSKAPSTLSNFSRPSSKSGVWSCAAALRPRWADKLRALFPRPASRPARATLSSPNRPPVQGELSLDKIKVVRNDLSDTDLEIVPLQSPTARTGATPVLQVVERVAQGGMTWGRFSGLFGAGKR